MKIPNLAAIPDGACVLLDANIPLYHFAGLSEQCTQLLERGQTGDLVLRIAATNYAEMLHRIVVLEARSRGLLGPGSSNPARKLRERPDVVRQCPTACQEERLMACGLVIFPTDEKILNRSREVRLETGLMVNDSLLVATARELEVDCLASADRDFLRVDGVVLHSPSDLLSPPSP